MKPLAFKETELSKGYANKEREKIVNDSISEVKHM